MTTNNEYRDLCLFVSDTASRIPQGWTINESFGNLCKNFLTGFEAAVFEKEAENGSKTVVIAFRCNNDLMDLPTIISLLKGEVSAQENNALNLYNAVTEYYKNDDVQIEFTGWSLGGAIAQLMASNFQNCNAVTFSALGVSNASGIDPNLSYNNIVNYTSPNDHIGNLIEHVGKTYFYYPDRLSEYDKVNDMHSYSISSVSFNDKNIFIIM